MHCRGTLKGQCEQEPVASTASLPEKLSLLLKVENGILKARGSVFKEANFLKHTTANVVVQERIELVYKGRYFSLKNKGQSSLAMGLCTSSVSKAGPKHACTAWEMRWPGHWGLSPFSVPFWWAGEETGFRDLAKALMRGRGPGLWFLGLEEEGEKWYRTDGPTE